MRALVLFPDGFAAEAFTVVDVLRRGFVETTTAGLTSTIVQGATKIKFMADSKLTDIRADDYDVLVLPGGSGHRNLLNSKAVIEIIKNFDKQKKYLAAMCESPIVLAKAGVIENKIVAVYPGYESQVPRPREAKVIVAGNVITCRFPADAIDFALKLVEIAQGKKTAMKLKQELIA